MWIKEDVDDMGLAANSIYLTAWGLAGSFSGLIVPGLLSACGSRGFTTLTNFTNFLACICWGGIPLGPRMWVIFTGASLVFVTVVCVGGMFILWHIVGYQSTY